MYTRRLPALCLAFSLAALLAPAPAGAVLRPSSDQLLPYFEVDFDNAFCRTTVFAVANDSDEKIDLLVTVHTNWGIPVLKLDLSLAADEVKTINLRDWIVSGALPGRHLSNAELADLQGALAGRICPSDGLYYADEVVPGRATGFITFKVKGYDRPRVLWGDYFVVDPEVRFAEGETLVDISSMGAECCTRHAVRFLDGGPLDTRSELMVWTDRKGSPATAAKYPSHRVNAQMIVYNEAGEVIDTRSLSMLPVQLLKIADLSLPEDFGWFDVITEDHSFITAHYTAGDRFSVAIHAYCLPKEAGPGLHPRIALDKRTNGADANAPPGPGVAVGAPVHWDYVVTNTGGLALSSIAVTDDDGAVVTCPLDSLVPGQTMTCTASGVAEPCQHGNTATVTGYTDEGEAVSDLDVSYYYGEEQGRIDLEKLVNGEDADTKPGPDIAFGASVAWTFAVTNTGPVTLSGIVVSDDQGVAVSCPKSELAPAESMTCTASGTAVAGQYKNVGTVVGKPACGSEVSDSDPAYYFGYMNSAIRVQKSTNGQDADEPPGPALRTGTPVTWTYLVTNVGNSKLTNVAVTDDKGVAVSCPKTVLEAGEAMTCTGSGTAKRGQYANVGTAAGKPPVGPMVTDQDPSHYLGQTPVIAVKKYTNGEDADTPPGPGILVGSAVSWTYVVTNSGDMELTDVQVTDDSGATVSCPKTVLAVGEEMTCTAGGMAVAGQYANLGTASGLPPQGAAVSASDPSHYFGHHPMVAIEKLTNGEDADSAPGPYLNAGDPVRWTYAVTNAGNVKLTGLVVTDSKGVVVSCPKSALEPGESMTCTGSGTAVAGQYSNLGTATGTPPLGAMVSDTDPSHYFGKVCTQGCTPGYWKNHTSSWAPTGYSTSQDLHTVFAEAHHFPGLEHDSLYHALGYGGGSGLEGAAEILLRAAVAAVLNAAHPDVSYPLSESQVISDTNAALSSNSRDTMLALAAVLDANNNLGCPLH